MSKDEEFLQDERYCDYENEELFDKVIIDNRCVGFVEKATGEEVGCKLCDCHERAYDKFDEDGFTYIDFQNIRCPECGKY